MLAAIVILIAFFLGCVGYLAVAAAGLASMLPEDEYPDDHMPGSPR